MYKSSKKVVFLFVVFLLMSAYNIYADTSLALDGNNIKAGNVNGLTFKGFGVLSANGTNELLMDYKSEHPEKYAELLNILFGGTNPIMTQVKIEMGNDRNNSTGPDPSTMRLESEAANVKRHPGFQLAADARKVNPNLKVSILRWNAPGWANTNDKIYTWYKNSILAAYRNYGYMVDYVNPGVNESGPDLTWTKTYSDRIKTDSTGFNNTTEQTLYRSIKVVISDEVGIGSFGDEMMSDTTLRNAVAVAAFHYNTDDDSAGNFKNLADQYDKEVWNSEAQATFSNSAFRPFNNMRDPSVAGTGIGGTYSALEMGNTIIKGFCNSRRTHFIYQPALGCFYEGGQYSFKELLSARDSWSGWIHYDAGLLILRHFNWFAKAGFENSSNTAGIWRGVPQSSYTGATGTNPVNGRNGTPSYMTLAAPDKRNFSTIFMNDSEYTQTYKLSTTNMAYTNKPALELWETRAADSGKAFNSNYLKYIGNASADAGGIYTITVKPYSVITATTLVNNGNAEYNTPLPVEGERTVLDTDATGAAQNTADNILYADNFDYSGKTVPVIGAGGQITGSESYITSRGGSKSIIPRYLCDRNGAFEAYLPDGSTDYILRQQVDQSVMGLGGTWNSGNPITGIGDYRWLNYKASVDVSFENNSTQNGNNYAGIGVRQQGGGSSHYLNGTPYFLKFWFDGGWSLLVDGTSVSSGNVVNGTGVQISGFNTAYNAWHNIALQAVDNKVTAYIDGVSLTAYTDAKSRLSGRIDLGSGYYYTRFDNLKVEKVTGAVPYYTETLDNLEMKDLASIPANKLVYGGSWSHANGQGMYTYERSLSTSSGTGSTLSYTFTGTGMDILGPNGGTARLEVTVDGQIVDSSAVTAASTELYQTFTLRGLSHSAHTVQVRVASGTLVVDAVAVVSPPDSVPTAEPTTAPTTDPTPAPTGVPTTAPTAAPTGVVNGSISIACGSSSAVGDFQPDQYYSGGSAYNNTNTIDVSQITSNTPPPELFNNERYGAMSYTIPGFASGSSYAVALYFAETYLTSSGSRLFNVSVNGAAMLSDFDIYASAGGQNKAIARSFTTTADSGGQIAIQFTAVTENPKINGISINPDSNATAAPTAAPTPGGILGDANGNGTVDIVDALLIAQYYVGLNPAGFTASNADVNCSSTIDIVDALLVAQYYVGLITSFPC